METYLVMGGLFAYIIFFAYLIIKPKIANTPTFGTGPQKIPGMIEFSILDKKNPISFNSFTDEKIINELRSKGFKSENLKNELLIFKWYSIRRMLLLLKIKLVIYEKEINNITYTIEYLMFNENRKEFKKYSDEELAQRYSFYSKCEIGLQEGNIDTKEMISQIAYLWEKGEIPNEDDIVISPITNSIIGEYFCFIIRYKYDLVDAYTKQQ